MLTPKQKRELKALASTLTIRYQIGKNEISDTLIDMLDKALTAHELIKIDVMKGCSLPIMEARTVYFLKKSVKLVYLIGFAEAHKHRTFYKRRRLVSED